MRPVIGLIGSHGAYGRWLRRFFAEKMRLDVLGRDTSGEQALDEAALVEASDVLVFCAPIRPTPAVIRHYTHVAAGAERGKLWLDITSTKREPVQALLASQAEVAGLHPMSAPRQAAHPAGARDGGVRGVVGPLAAVAGKLPRRQRGRLSLCRSGRPRLPDGAAAGAGPCAAHGARRDAGAGAGRPGRAAAVPHGGLRAGSGDAPARAGWQSGHMPGHPVREPARRDHAGTPWRASATPARVPAAEPARLAAPPARHVQAPGGQPRFDPSLAQCRRRTAFPPWRGGRCETGHAGTGGGVDRGRRHRALLGR